MREPLRTLLLQYGTPMVSAVLAALLTCWLQPLLTSGHFLFFLTAVAIGAWVAGFRGGLLAALLSPWSMGYVCTSRRRPPGSAGPARGWTSACSFWRPPCSVAWS